MRQDVTRQYKTVVIGTWLFVRHPLCASYEVYALTNPIPPQSALGPLEQRLDEGSLMFIKVDGCMVGYHDPESHLPHRKPSFQLLDRDDCCREDLPAVQV